VAVGFARRVVLNSARGSRSGNFAAQDGAKARGKSFRRRGISPRPLKERGALPRSKLADNLPRESFGACVGDALIKQRNDR
jgi:hypothetical protein